MDYDGMVDKAIAMALITRAVEITATGQPEAIQHLLHSGFRPEDLDMLRRMPISDVQHLAGFREPLFAIKVRAQNMRRALDGLNRRHAAMELQQEFLYRGASYRMMRAIFGVSREQVRNMLAALGLPANQKRKPLPDNEERIRIVQAWERTTGGMAERYIELNNQFPRLSMSVLWTVTQNEGGEQ
jgi:hypothetical protein